MRTQLYKVSAPRADKMFHPSTFWHTPDWESSTTRRREGCIEDDVLYAGDFDEVSIHLFPRVRTVRVRSADVDATTLRDLGLRCVPGKSAYIFTHHSRRTEIESFHPTVFRFRVDGFVRVWKGEFISRVAQQAISAETMPIADAIDRWNVQACYVDELDGLTARLTRRGIYYDAQT